MNTVHFLLNVSMSLSLVTELPDDDFLGLIRRTELDADDLFRGSRHILAHKICADRQFAMTTVNEYGQLDGLGAPCQ